MSRKHPSRIPERRILDLVIPNIHPKLEKTWKNFQVLFFFNKNPNINVIFILRNKKFYLYLNKNFYIEDQSNSNERQSNECIGNVFGRLGL